MNILQFILSGFWTFVGFWILFSVIFAGLTNIILAIRGVEVHKCPECKKKEYNNKF